MLKRNITEDAKYRVLSGAVHPLRYLRGDAIDTVGPLSGLDGHAGPIYLSGFFGSVTCTPGRTRLGRPGFQLGAAPGRAARAATCCYHLAVIVLRIRTIR